MRSVIYVRTAHRSRLKFTASVVCITATVSMLLCTSQWHQTTVARGYTACSGLLLAGAHNLKGNGVGNGSAGTGTPRKSHSGPHSGCLYRSHTSSCAFGTPWITCQWAYNKTAQYLRDCTLSVHCHRGVQWNSKQAGRPIHTDTVPCSTGTGIICSQEEQCHRQRKIVRVQTGIGGTAHLLNTIESR